MNPGADKVCKHEQELSKQASGGSLWGDRNRLNKAKHKYNVYSNRTKYFETKPVLQSIDLYQNTPITTNASSRSQQFYLQLKCLLTELTKSFPINAQNTTS